MILHLESVMKVRGSIIVIRAKLTSIWCPKSHWVLYFKAYVDYEIYQRVIEYLSSQSHKTFQLW